MDSTGDAVNLIGKRFDERYLVKRALGSGGLSVVYLAIHEETGRLVALKVLLPQFSNDQLKARRFQQEAKFLSLLDHPNIAKIHTVGITGDGSIYLTMEYLDGANLHELAHGEPLPTDRLLEIFKQLGQGVAYAHERQIIHRDLKPHNVMVVGADQPGVGSVAKILDFGIAKLAVADEKARQKLTATGSIVGTAAYMSPEQMTGSEIDVRSDIYSFGCMLYEGLTGHPPFAGDNQTIVMAAHLDMPPPPIPLPQGDAARAALARVSLKCLEKSPGNRIQTMDRVLELLEDIDQDGDADVESMNSSGGGIWSSKSRWLAGVVALLIIVIGAAVEIFSMGNPPAVESTENAHIPTTALGFVDRADRYRDMGWKTEANGVGADNYFQLAAADYRQALRMKQATEDRRDTILKLCEVLSLPRWAAQNRAETVKLYKDYLSLTEEVVRTEKPLDWAVMRNQAHAHMQLAILALFYDGNLQDGRREAEAALAVDNRTKSLSNYSQWPSEMVARYSRQPQKAADYAGKTLDWLNTHPDFHSPQEMYNYMQDALIDYVSSGMSVRDARSEVCKRLEIYLGEIHRERDLAAELRKAYPDGSEHKLLPAHNQQSRLVKAKIPK